MEIEREDIKLPPEWPWLTYSDGLLARVVSIKQKKDVRGKDVWELRIIPTPELAKFHNITLDKLDKDMVIKVEYPLEYLQQLSPNPAYPAYFCFVNFKGEEVESTKFWKGKLDADKILSLKQIIRQREGENAYLREKLHVAETNTTEFLKKFVMGPTKELTAELTARLQEQTQSPVRSE